MQIKVKFLNLILCPLIILGCSNNGGVDGWVSSRNVPVVPLLSTEIGSHEIKELNSALESELEGVMIHRSVDYVGAEAIVKSGLASGGGGFHGVDLENGYFVRALSDNGNGNFSAYVMNGDLLVLYNKMGRCSKLRKRVIFIRLDKAPRNVYSGCSAAL